MTKQREAFESLELVKNTICLETYSDGEYKSIFAIVAYDVFKAAQADKLDFARKVAESFQKSIVAELNAMEVCNCCNDASDIPEYCAETIGDINDEDIAVIIAKVEQEK